MKYFLILFLFFTSVKSFAQTVSDSVKTTIQSFFAAMKNSDSLSIKDCFTNDAIMQTIKLSGTSVSVISNSVEKFAGSIGKLPKDSADERIVFENIQIDDCLATVWTPYQFYYNNKFLHCGTNHFTLVRINGTWKIQYIIDTRRKMNCTN